MLDKYASYNDCAGNINNPLAGIENQTDFSETPNGAFYNVIYTDPAGNPLSAPSAPVNGVAPPAFAGAPYISLNGTPCVPFAWLAGTTYPVGSLVLYNGAIYQAAVPVVGTAPVAPAWTNLGNIVGLAQPIYFRWGSTEKLVLSPFVFSDCHEWDTGLFGINNIQ
jgi:hypothetical protein